MDRVGQVSITRLKKVTTAGNHMKNAQGDAGFNSEELPIGPKSAHQKDRRRNFIGKKRNSTRVPGIISGKRRFRKKKLEEGRRTRVIRDTGRPHTRPTQAIADLVHNRSQNFRSFAFPDKSKSQRRTRRKHKEVEMKHIFEPLLLWKVTSTSRTIEKKGAGVKQIQSHQKKKG